MKLHFFGGAGCVTGVNYLLETDQGKFLIDCGLFQGEKKLEDKNSEPFVYDAAEIKAVLVTHPHLDHIGRLPQLVKAGFRGKIFATPPTVDFTRVILEDSAKVLQEKARKAGIVPFFSQIEVDEVMQLFVRADYYQKTKLADDIFFTFYEAGHVLGSAIIEIEAQGQKIVFSGDLGHPPAPLLRPPDFLEEADYVLVESTYGDRTHESSDQCKELIENVVEETIDRGGVLLIPSFALERTQQLLYHLNELVEHKRIPVVPVFVDSPLASRATQVYEKYRQYYNKETTLEIEGGDDIFNFPGLRVTHSSEESKNINKVKPPKIIIAGSGMSQGGRILHHEALYLGDPKTTILFVTYQAVGTLGRKIFDGEKKIKILDQEVEIRARIERISGYSSHADQSFLMDWLRNFQKPCYSDGDKGCHLIKKIFVVQGEEKPSATLAGLIRDELGIEAVQPKMGEVAEL
ncbi:MBL fold metallo-hydrolase [Patescibacteria group bacterium]|nr:MBL fold metallo-hydrolase [Patescibacteria group bacterium]